MRSDNLTRSAIGAGVPSNEGLARARKLAAAMALSRQERSEPLEIWHLDETGRQRDIEVLE